MNCKIKILFISLIILLLPDILKAYKIKGRVIDFITKEPIVGVPVTIDKTNIYTKSDGSFIYHTPKKSVKIVIDISGYEPFKKIIKQPYKYLEIELKLSSEFTLEKIYIRDRQNIVGSKQKLTKSQIRKTTTHLFSDTLKVVQTLPGVVIGNDFASIMYIRGGEYYETISFLENVYISTPYIWGGLQSVFNPSFVDTIEFYSGGFPVKYPQALSAVIDVKNIEGDFKKHRGFVELSAATFETFIQGPISKDKSSYVFGIRRTQYDLIMNIMQKDKNIVYPFFYDAQSKIVWKINKHNKIYFNTVSSYEGMDFNIVVNEHNGGEGSFHYKDLRFLPSLNWEYMISNKLGLYSTISCRYYKGTYNYDGKGIILFSSEKLKMQEIFSDIRLKYITESHNIEFGIYNFTRWIYSDTQFKYRTLMTNGIYITNRNSYKYNWIPYTISGTFLWILYQ